MNGAGFAWILAGVITLLTFAITGDLAGGNAFLPPVIGAVGIGTILYNGKRLERWAGKYAVQMDYIVDRARTMLGGEPKAPLPPEKNHPSIVHRRDA